MSEYQGCDNCKYNGKTKSELPCIECSHNAIDHWKPMTNADRIRGMDVTELAKFLPIVSSLCCRPSIKCMEATINRGECSKSEECYSKWLQAEVEGESE